MNEIHHLRISQLGGGARVEVTGEIDSSNAPHLLERITASVPPNQGLSIDLSGVTYIDSHGLRLLHQLSQRHDGLRLITPDDSFTALVLRITPLPDVTIEPA